MIRSTTSRLRACSGGLLLLTLGCQDPGPLVCTATFEAQVFASYAVTVIDETGAPVNGVDVTVTLPRTGERLVPQTLELRTPGTYTIVDDGAIPRLRSAGEQVRVDGAKAPGSFVANYVFDVPDGCHVRKVSGPDTVTLR